MPYKSVFVLLILTFLAYSLDAQEQKNITLKVTIIGLKSNKGSACFAIYDSKDNFLKKGDFLISKIENQKSIAVFKGLKKGDYAVSFFHDENNNKKMDTRIFGIPKESYGFSNNAKGFMGPPKFKDAKITLEKDTTLFITLK